MLGVLVIVLLLVSAGTAVWILRSSLPSKPAATPSSVVVTISPESAHMLAGKTFHFSAIVSGTDDTQVIWTVQEGSAGGRVVTRRAKAKGGTVSSRAVYIAPSTPGTYHVLATSKCDPRQSASAEATITKRRAITSNSQILRSSSSVHPRYERRAAQEWLSRCPTGTG